MDEPRLEFGQKLDVILDSHVELGRLRITAAEEFGDQVTCMLDQCE
jgi:hypothetical protein